MVLIIEPFFKKKNLLLRSKYFMKNWMLINNLNFFSIHKFLSGQNEKSPKDQFFFHFDIYSISLSD